tara:strand:+ start:95 stop:307 length:213 start_codon:yes stop_codon:yes gene_type:complete
MGKAKGLSMELALLSQWSFHGFPLECSMGSALGSTWSDSWDLYGFSLVFYGSFYLKHVDFTEFVECLFVF